MPKDSRKNNGEDSLPKNWLAKQIFKVDLLQVIPEQILVLEIINTFINQMGRISRIIREGSFWNRKIVKKRLS